MARRRVVSIPVPLKTQFFRFAPVLMFALGISDAQNSSESDVRREVVRLREAVGQLQSEILALRRIVTDLELERRRETVLRIKAELEITAAERARLADMDRSRQQDLEDVEGALATSDAQGEQRADFESARSELAVARAREIEEKSEALTARESELRRRLETERQAVGRLEEAARQFRKGQAK